MAISEKNPITNKPDEKPDAQADFDRQYNLSCLDPNLPRASFRQALRHYLVSALLYGAALLFVTVSPWFQGLLRPTIFDRAAAWYYVYAYAAYLTIAPLIVFIFRPRSLWTSKNLLIGGYLARLFRLIFRRPSPEGETLGWRPAYAEKHALMFFAIKLFYGPLMINSALMALNAPVWKECRTLPDLFGQIRFGQGMLFFDTCFRLMVAAAFVIDGSLFAFGYHTESALLKNRVRYVETNPWHILVCIICYGPFNMATAAFFGPSNHEMHILFCRDLAHPMTWVLRGVAVLCLLLMTASSLSLFTKASNLTNRGIVTWGPYRFIRHPGYFGKNIFWLTTLIPSFAPYMADPLFTWKEYLLFCVMTVWGFIGWSTIYFLRAITEERLLMRDPDYVAYCQKVKYRFIPGVF
ncbi:MAG: hypothetical protein NTX50_31870 [Candidatus Sumerlaeota bacterium]|nr:hypothetical protein [Candidatus Sumerlaeota bacterium]